MEFIDYDSNDMEFIFDRTMIANEQEQTSTVMSASSQLSQRTILSNLPMVKDVDEEIEQLNEEDEYEPKVSNEDDEEDVDTGEEDKEENIINDEIVPNKPDKSTDK